jgi:hemerythrin-like domain-containing protein
MSPEPLPDRLPGFDEPLALLSACHTKMLAHCDLLERLVAAPGDDTREEEAREAKRKVIGYFTTSAPQHHQDEESDLFPLLVRQSLKLADLIHSLKQEHRQLAALWEALLPELQRLPEVADHQSLVEKTTVFCELNRQHIRRENMEFLPLAESSLSRRQLKDIGIAMAGRRGVRYPG